MSRRYLSLQLTDLAIDRLRLKARQRGAALPEPLALHIEAANGTILHAVDRSAAAAGIAPGMRLADARAILPSLALAAAVPEADRRFLEGLALACLRYTPAVAVDEAARGQPALLLDITGCAHLFSGERGLLADLARRLDRRQLGHRLAIADNPSLARAWARHGKGGVLKGIEAGSVAAGLPIAALCQEDALNASLQRLGLRRIGQLKALPQRSLVRRFGRELVLAMARLEGLELEPFTPLREPPRFAAETSWAEPIGRTEAIAAAIRSLLERLAIELERATAGARRLELLLFRVDGEVAKLTVRAGRPSRHAAHLAKLFELQLDGLDIGFGIESLRLEVVDAAPLRAEQTDLAQSHDAAELARLVDQLRLRLGSSAVQRLVPRASHWPERAQITLDPAMAGEGAERWLACRPRPLRLLDRPTRIDAMATVPDGPPRWLRRAGRGEKVREASGPERIEPEWWHHHAPLPRPRDYYRVVDASGRLLWLYREGRFDDADPPAWYVHGVFE